MAILDEVADSENCYLHNKAYGRNRRGTILELLGRSRPAANYRFADNRVLCHEHERRKY